MPPDDSRSIGSRFLIEYSFLRHFMRRIRRVPRGILFGAARFLGEHEERLPNWIREPLDRTRNRIGNRIRSRDWNVRNIQLEITYRCNLRCPRCNRHCDLDLSYLRRSDMTIEQLERFIAQVKRKGARLDRLALMGGEPLVHPQVEEFISLIFYELIVPGYVDHVEIVTNGIMHRRGSLGRALGGVMRDPHIRRAFRIGMLRFKVSAEGAEEGFLWVLAAPLDLGLESRRCGQPRNCGTLLNAHGYWPGGVCGAIAKLLGKTEYQRFDFPVRFHEAWPDLEEDLCQYCVFGSDELQRRLASDKRFEEISPSFQKALEKWRSGNGPSFERF